MRENDDTIFCCTIPVLCIMSFLISSELVPFSVKVSIVYIGLSFGFSLDLKIDQLPIRGQPLADIFDAIFQTVP